MHDVGWFCTLHIIRRYYHLSRYYVFIWLAGVRQTCQRIAEHQQRLLANNNNTRPAEHNDVTVDPGVVALQNKLRFPPGIEVGNHSN